MSKKLGALLLMLALVLQLLPPLGVSIANAAPTQAGSFVFPDESYDVEQPRTTSDERVTLNGTINNVTGSSITYSVYQVVNVGNPQDPSTQEFGSKRENLTSSIFLDGFKIQIYNLQLFPGLNRITFTGVQGGSQVSSSIYINYRNGPVFYDLKAQLDGNTFPISDLGTTVVESQNSRGDSSVNIAIAGNAPNATEVMIDVNGNNKVYPVSSGNKYSFIASGVNLRKGKNLVKISISNQGQTITTTREIAFYNGEVTFYDMNIDDGVNTSALEYSPKFQTDTIGNVKLAGSMIVPRMPDDNDPATPPVTQPAVYNAQYDLKSSTSNATVASGTITGTIDPSTPVDYAGKFFIYNFEIPAATLNFDKYTLVMKAVNPEKALTESSPTYSFSIINNSAPYIAQVNYLPGYTTSTTNGDLDSMEGVELSGKSIYNLPLAVELLVANPPSSGSGADLLNVTSGGKTSTDFIEDGIYTDSSYPKVVNGVNTNFERIIIKLSKLPFEGSQKLNFSFDTSATPATVDGSATLTLLFGPYVNYSKVFDTYSIKYDTTSTTQLTDIVENKLDMFRGRIENMVDPSDIHYDYDSTTKSPQTIFFYLNNTLVHLVQDGTGDVTKFIVDSNDEAKAEGALLSGENTIRFVYQGAKNSYEKAIRFYLVPTNLPVIPVEDSLGIFPYNANSDTPLPGDPDFTLTGSIYSTKKSQMKVFGTFDFTDLGTSAADVQGVIDAMKDPAVPKDDRLKYILKVESTNFPKDPIVWDLSKELRVYDSKHKDAQAVLVNPGAAGTDSRIAVSYDIDTQSFSFILNTQDLNPNGSSSVYNFYVYNSGLNGPRSSYRLEVDPIALPYDLVRPLLPTKGIVNQNFVEVVIKAPSADTVTVNKVKADKIKYDADNDGNPDYEAYHAMVEGLKPGVNKIPFTITNKNDTTSDFFNITYAPTNIPGAAFLQAMGSTNKVFDGALTVNLPKGTSLIRKDYNVPAQYKNQVFSGNKLMFAIANPKDGVVDRHEFETLPVNFQAAVQQLGNQFNVFVERFSKASPVYWIDAGLADDLVTPQYDPLTYGVDPIQFPNATGSYGTAIPTYANRPDDRILMPSKTGAITLSFDSSMRDSVGTVVTVFHYSVESRSWENLGGVVDTKKNTITVPFSDFGYYVAGTLFNSFWDITSHPYARNYMEAMYSKGIMNAAGREEFGANMYVSRGEFARMLVKALDIPLKYDLETPHFDDVSPNINSDALWDYRYIETAANEGIIRGTQPKTFEPGDDLTREEAAVILSRALDTKMETDATKNDKTLQKQFKDYAKIDYYARAAVAAIAKKGYITGSPVDPQDPKKGYTFEAQSSLLRSDAAIIIGKVLADLKRLPKLN